MKDLFTILFATIIVSTSLGQQRLISIIHEKAYGGTLEETHNETFIYNPNGTVAVKNISYVSGSQDQESYTYDVNGRLSELITTRSASADMPFNNLGRKRYNYDVSGNLILMLTDFGTSAGWDPYSKESYTYDGSGFLVQTELQIRSQGMWLIYEQSIITNSTLGDMLQNTKNRWNNNSQALEVSQRWTYTYTTFRKTQTMINELIINGNLENIWQEEYTYDPNQLKIEKQISRWNGTSWNLPSSRVKYTNNADGQLHLELTQHLYTDGSWRDTSLLTYNYSADFDVVGLSELAEELTEIYPNPASDAIYVKFTEATQAKIEILDLQGKLVKSVAFSDVLHAVSLEGIPAGVYLIAVEASGKRDVKKIIKQ